MDFTCLVVMQWVSFWGLAAVTAWGNHCSEASLEDTIRQHYRCRKCAENASEREPASSSLPLRVLHLYALVGTSGPAPTPLHMQPVRLVVTAPPPEWAWGLDDVTDVFAGGRSAALPQQGRDSVGAHWRFNKPGSEAI